MSVAVPHSSEALTARPTRIFVIHVAFRIIQIARLRILWTVNRIVVGTPDLALAIFTTPCTIETFP